MRIPKFPAIICVAALVGAVSFNVKGDDTEAQAKARELLRQKMSELNGQPASPAAPARPVAPAAPVAPATPVAPAQPATPPAPAMVSPDVRSANSDQIEKAREAMRQKITELNTQQGTSSTSAKQAAAEAAGKQKADASLAAKQKKMDAEKAMTTAAAKPAAPTAPAAPAPASMTPGSKEQRLYDLLQQYKNDKITPAQYHEQRAKILSE